VKELLSYAFSSLREGDVALYRGSGSGLMPILLVAAEETLPGHIERLEHEYALKGELDADWAARPIALTRYNDRMTLVLEDPGGVPVDRLLGRPLDVSDFLRIAIPLAAALRQMHERGLIHKDIKPANILVDAASSGVWLTGFGIASRLPREHQAPAPPEMIAGTLAYMAPEQTGRMNRSVDARSDLYALGVTFYEMLTGTLPFTAADPMEWVHCHIARQPMPPNERVGGVPGPLSAIVVKLLAKTSEERYQTAAGVEADLRRCRDEWESRRHIDAFSLGLRDTSDRLLIPEKLYGRESEIASLVAAFDRVVAHGRQEFVLVSGYSGVGKSSVVNELHKVLVPPRGLFAAGKFDQYKRDIPYTTLAQALRTLVRQILIKSEAEVDHWRHALREAVEPNGQLIVNLVPEVEFIIGKQPPVPDLPPRDAQNRFQLVIRRFLGAFATPEHPLALFLDDLQWLDAATLDLLEHIVTHSEVRHLLLVGAYRDNEVSPSHPLVGTLEAIRKAGARVQDIVLAPLGPADVGRFVADALHCELERVWPLSQMVHAKTGGNPFFAIQFFTALAEGGLLAFDPVSRAWQWNIDNIRAQSYTDNVVDLMAGKLTRLPIETQAALQQLACLGNVAEITMLSIALGKSNENVRSDLWSAIRLELVERREGSYKFIHDRVQEAAYSLIPEQLRAEAHLRIGRLLAAHTPAEKREEAVFEIVNQLDRGAALITAWDEREQLAELNLLAGKRAKASTAYASALTYLVAGAALLPDDSWERRHALIFELELNRAECEFLTGAHAEAEERLTALSTRAANTVEQASVACLRVDVYLTLDQSERAVTVGLEYLRDVGVDLPAHPSEEDARREYDRTWSRVRHQSLEEFVNLPLMSDPASLATLDVMTKVSAPANFASADLASIILCRAVNLSLERGHSDGSCVALALLGMITAPHFGDYQAAIGLAQLGYELVERRGLNRFQAETYIFAARVMQWTQHVRAGRDLTRAAFAVASRSGNLIFASFSCNNLVSNFLAAGDALHDVQREAEHGLAFARKAKFGLVIDFITSQLGLIRTLRGLTPKFGCFDEGEFNELQFEGHLANSPALAIAEYWYWIRKLQARFFADDYAAAVDASSIAQRLLRASPLETEIAEYHYYAGLSRAAQWDTTPPDERQQHLRSLAAHHEQLLAWAADCPENFENRAALVGAELARIEGRDLDAMRSYDEAIRSARANDFVHNEALANELAARFYAGRGFEKIARVYLRDARYGYLRWGADGKVRHLDRLHPSLAAPEAHRPTANIGSPVQQLDVASIVKGSQAVSGEIVLPKLIERLMTIALENAGADRGLLILPAEEDHLIQAEAKAAGDQIEVVLCQKSITGVTCPESIVRYVIRTRESVILDDASKPNIFSADDYLRARQTKSILCLPLIKQGRLMGLLYLENTLTSYAFPPDRIAILELLAAQAAISLENTRLYGDLQEREAKVRRLVDSNIIGILILDPEGRILEANEAFLHMVGYSRDDLISGRLSRTALTPDEWSDATERAQVELRATGRCKAYEKEYFRKDGTRVPVFVGGATFGGSRDDGVGFVLDLTERKRSEEALRERAQLLELTHDSIFVRNMNDVVSFWNQGAERLYGWSKEEALGHVAHHLLQTIFPVPLEQITSELLSTGRWEGELVHTKRDGTQVTVASRWSLRRDERGRPLGVLETNNDITERKRAEYLTGHVFESSPDSICIVGTDYRVQRVNPVFERFWGKPAATAVGMPLVEIIGTEFFERTAKPSLDRCFAGEEVSIADWYATPRGRRYRVVSHSPLRPDSQRVEAALLIARDFTDYAQASEALREAQTQLAHVNRVTTMGQLTASIAHEVKQPIAAVIANADAALRWLGRGPPDLEEVRQSLDSIIKDSNRAGDVIDRIRALVKKAPARQDRLDINETILEVIEVTRSEVLRNGVSLQTELARGLPLIQGDRIQLQQIVLNLIMNAVEAMSDASVESRDLLISTVRDESIGVLAAVRDSGPGLEPERLERLFDPFYTTKPGGMGMGLSICRSIVEAHGGRVWATANVPRGACFHFSLPADGISES
jgi:PAS domain S-box-containing protein